MKDSMRYSAWKPTAEIVPLRYNVSQFAECLGFTYKQFEDERRKGNIPDPAGGSKGLEYWNRETVIAIKNAYINAIRQAWGYPLSNTTESEGGDND